MRTTKLAILIGIGVLVAPPLAMAVITFNQLDDDIFVVSHQIKGFGSRGKAMKLVYEKAASLCVAAGYTHFQILDQESEAGGYNAANASVRARFFFEDGEERIDCKQNSDDKYIEQAAAKLQKTGFQRPDPATRASAKAEAKTGSCTVEQISAMAKAGLSAEQIKAACEDG